MIEYCSRLSDELDLKNLSFAVGDIAEFGEDKKPDIIITLHACDTATDYALNYAIKKRRVRDSFCALLPARNKFAA